MTEPPDDGFTRIDSDLDPRRRRLRNLGFVGIPTLAAGILVLLLGLPAWIVGAFLAFFVLYVYISN